MAASAPAERSDHTSALNPRSQRKSDRRLQLLAAAERLFAERGFLAVRLEDIGAATGVSGPAIYRHFPNKQALAQAQEQELSASDTVISDVGNAYAAVKSNEEVVQLYVSGYLKQAQDSRDISEYAYKRGAASLLDFLDAERTYRSNQLAYRQALASYMTALEQMRQAVGTRDLP